MRELFQRASADRIAHRLAIDSSRESVSDRPVPERQSSGVNPMSRYAVRTAMQMLETVTETSRKLGPYVLLEVLLPGGTLFALMLFVYRHPARARIFARRARRTASRRWLACGRASPPGRVAAVAYDRHRDRGARARLVRTDEGGDPRRRGNVSRRGVHRAQHACPRYRRFAVAVAIVHSRALAGVTAPRVSVEVHLAGGCRRAHRRACRKPRCGKRATACVPRCRTRSSSFRRARSPSVWRRPTCRRSPAASTCRSRSASSRRAGNCRRHALAGYEFAGELALTGELRAIRGALAMVLSARHDGRAFVLPQASAAEAALVRDATCCRRRRCWRSART